MSRQLLGIFSGEADPSEIADAMMAAIADAMGATDMTSDETASVADDTTPTRLDSGVGDPSKDPYSQEQLIQAQLDRL